MGPGPVVGPHFKVSPMTKTVPLALIALLMLVAPTVAAQDGGGGPSMEGMMEEVQSLGDLTVTVASKEVTFDWSGIEVGPNMSAWIRKMVDDIGNGDGFVNASEMEYGEAVLKLFVRQEINSIITDVGASGYFLIDTNNAQAADVTSLMTDGLVGEVNGTQPITLDFTASLGFATRSKDVHTVRLDMGKYYFVPIDNESASAFAGDFTLTVVGGDGWAIDGDSVQPQCAADAWDESTGSLTFNAEDVECFTGHTGLLLAFSISGGNDGGFAPGLGLPLLILGLIGAVAVARRRN
jgi:hypothetical protein